MTTKTIPTTTTPSTTSVASTAPPRRPPSATQGPSRHPGARKTLERNPQRHCFRCTAAAGRAAGADALLSDDVSETQRQRKMNREWRRGERELRISLFFSTLSISLLSFARAFESSSHAQARAPFDICQDGACLTDRKRRKRVGNEAFEGHLSKRLAAVVFKFY